jgi:hypothetical protein
MGVQLTPFVRRLYHVKTGSTLCQHKAAHEGGWVGQVSTGTQSSYMGSKSHVPP